MIKTLFAIMFFAISINPVSSQCKDSVRNTGSGLFDVHVFSNGEFIACGAYGQIIKSKDGGASWRSINSTNGFFYRIGNMSFPSDSIGFAVGYRCILKTEDRGETWIPLYSSIGYFYTDVTFINNETGFIISSEGNILKTIDGGRNWFDSYATYEGLSSIYFKNDSTGYITGPSGFIFNTTDTGRTWKRIAFSTQYGGRLNKITFVNQNIGFAVGESGIVLKTIDGGNSWVQQQRYSDAYFFDVLFLNENVGFVVGDFNTGLIMKTTNGGTSWSQLNPGFTGSLFSLNIDHTSNKLIIVGSQGAGSSGEGRYILTSIDEGTSWTRESSNYRYNFYATQYLNNNTVFIAGEEGRIYKSKDKGESWKELNFTSQNPTSDALFFINESKGFLFNNKDLYNGDELYETADGGNTWTRNAFPDTPVNSNERGRKIFFWNTNVGLAIKETGIFKTIDGGKTWAKKRNNIIGSIDYDVFKAGSFQKNGKGFVITFFGKLFQTNDYGETWNQIDLYNSNEVFQTVYMVDDSLAFIGANSGLIYKTNNGGKNWVSSSTAISPWNVVNFHFVNPSTGYASCHNYGGIGNIYQTNDTGKTWRFLLQTDETHQISGFDKDFIVAGNYGTILKNYTESVPITGYIAGPTKACLNDMQVYNTALIGSNRYQWQLSEGGASTFAANIDSILWNIPGKHSLSLTTINNCGIGTQRQIIVEVMAFEPVITQADTILTATEGLSYQWYRNNSPIPASTGGTSRRIVVRQAGTFIVNVKSFYGCSRTTEPFTYNVPELCPNGSTTLTSDLTGTIYQWQMNTGNGFANISNSNYYYSGVNTASLRLLYAPSAWYGYQYRCLADSSYSDTIVLKFSNTWTGTYSSAWQSNFNWLCGSAPDSNTDVIIRSGTVVINSNVSCRSLTVYPGAQLIINSGYILTVIH